ncbi:glycosyltransferase family 4 protein [Arthrobacter gyeryongensis]|uniref:Glycosyltransferase family 4 protein n=1 Tax=Arthrobacter gyeryongensis TaxID=1650592 RepID=A0ABP9SSC1_9MICC
MRIGLVAGPWIPVPPQTYGGIERVVDLLARGFAGAGHEVVLAASSDSRCPVPRVPGMRTSDPTSLGFTISELSHLIRAYEGLGEVDIIHDHTLAGPLYRYGPPGVPVVTTIHGPLTSSAKDIYRAIGRTTSIIAISRNQASQASGIPVRGVIHHGIDLSTVPVGTGRGGYVCFVGRMCPDKGVLEAIRIARQAGVPLRIAAKMREPEEIQYFEEVIKPILGPNEDFTGEVDDAGKYHLMGEALAFLNPIQWSEPFGLVMIEALSTGTPVLGTPLGAAPEIVAHGLTGYLASADDLAAMIPAAAGLSRAQCRARVEQQFSAERMVADHLQLFADLIEEQCESGLPDSVALNQNL